LSHYPTQIVEISGGYFLETHCGAERILPPRKQRRNAPLVVQAAAAAQSLDDQANKPACERQRLQAAGTRCVGKQLADHRQDEAPQYGALEG